MKNKAVFLDRDGTINYDSGYLSDPNKAKLYDGVFEGISLLKNKYNFKIIVISNQSGITRGLMTEMEVIAVNKKINELLSDSIDDFFFCPYHPDFDIYEKTRCRKPSPQMVFDAASKYKIDLNQSFFIGDRETDMICAKSAGTYSILLGTTMNNSEINRLKNSKNSPNFITYNFLDAVKHIQMKLDGEIVEN